MAVELIIQIADAGGGPLDKSVSAVRQAALELGLKLEPVHPDTADRQLSTYFRARVASGRQAASVAEAMRKLPSVLSAYVKPADKPA